MKANELRQKYLDFFKSKGHTIIPSESLIPQNDPTTLFTSSGMQPLVPYLMGEKHPMGTKLTNSQKSFRSEDIEEVGDNRHNTFFEMLGNWSLGDYFKQEQIPWMFEFLIDVVGLDPARLYTTVYRGNEEIGIERDMESVNLWKKLFKDKGIEAIDIDFAEDKGMQGGRIFYYGDKKNWWSRSGIPAKMPIGEIGGPDSEMFYDLGADLKKHENSQWKDEPCHVNCDCGRFIEIGNNVFMEFRKTENGFEKLPQRNVDFGGGLERILMAAEGKDNIFETDLFVNILNKLTELTNGKTYKENMHAFEVISDHLKAATFIMGDNKGIAPANTDQGYIVRRLIRRAIRYGMQIGINKNDWAKEIAQIVISDYGDTFIELERNKNFILAEMSKEEEKFSKTLENGLKEFKKWTMTTSSAIGIIPGKVAFDLFTTYGFPIEMTVEMAKELHKQVDLISFEEELKKHQDLSRTASAGMFKGGLADQGEETKKLHTAAHLLLAALRKVLGNHVVQRGSNITAERLRFDFSHPDKMTDEQKQAVEKLVNEAIEATLPVSVEEITLDDAKAKGAMGVFESKYGEMVKVYAVGEGTDRFSYEICGGPHINNTSELGKFKIQKEESSSSGVRRIKAILS
ncbi:alanine--tRNA ligase [Candidatus Parcubacteria bacterium]|nr:alanine--tRNA ligase [Patescibacteria group bacterium]MBU4309296.1 alanine--tRNA ligase [Patescibacteria group bacterium]MBU4432273.1 alanine--tRNA ligase [Patescibacteria group bacterium]MBU4577657.1 alanine--tRNA ligase [Patescibacteria group bacterium]MCG2697343.1 alanine--tRNA ligase [Candidatus Parcubacteria bacterium]